MQQETTPITVAMIRPYCSERTWEGVEAAIARLSAAMEQQARQDAEERATVAESRVAELEARIASSNGSVPTVAESQK